MQVQYFHVYPRKVCGAQFLPDAMSDQFWDLREDQRTLDEILDYFSALYKVESDFDLETQLRNIRQDESDSGYVPLQVDEANATASDQWAPSSSKARATSVLGYDSDVP